MIKDTRNLINMTKNRLYLFQDKLRKRQNYLNKLIDDKEELLYFLDNYNETIDINEMNASVANICNILHIRLKPITKTFINEIIIFINGKIKEVSSAAESHIFRISEYKSVLNLFDMETATLKNGIESIETYNAILKVLNEETELDILSKNHILQELNKQNLTVLKKRDELNRRKSRIEAAKKIAKERLKKDIKERETPYVKVEQEILLTKEQEEILHKCETIINKNKNIIDEGFSAEIIEAYKLGHETNEVLVGVLDSDNENLLLIIREIYGYLKDFSNSKDTTIISNLEMYLNLYNEYQDKINSKKAEQLKIKSLEKKNEELTEKLNSIASSYQKQYERLTEDDLNRIASVNAYLKESINLTDEERIKQVNSICSSSNVDYKTYQELTLQKEIVDQFESYQIEEEYEKKKDLLENLQKLLEEYIEFIETTRLINISDNEKYNEENILLYLTNQDNITCIEEFFHEGKTEVVDVVKKIKKSLKEFNTSSRNLIFTKSEVVKHNKGTRTYNEKVRKVRYGDIRVIYADINAFGNMDLPLSKPCYVILTCGPKLGRTEIYDYVNSKYVMDLVEDFYKSIYQIKEKVQDRKLSPEDEEKALLEEFNKFVIENHELYNNSIENISRNNDKQDNLEKEKGVVKNG